MLSKTRNALPQRFRDWFAARGWTPHAPHLALLDADRTGESAPLVAPTGGGKTLAGFLPTLIALAEAPRTGLHTLYVSPPSAHLARFQRLARTAGASSPGIFIRKPDFRSAAAFYPAAVSSPTSVA